MLRYQLVKPLYRKQNRKIFYVSDLLRILVDPGAFS